MTRILVINPSDPPVPMFYIRSRGISKADAQRMLLPNLKDPNFCWFEFDDQFRDIFPPGTGTVYPLAGKIQRGR